MKGTIDRRSLCDRCKSGIAMEAPGGRRMVFCRMTQRRTFPDVTSCTGYQPIGAAGFWMNGWGGEAAAGEAQIVDPRPRPGQHL